MMKLLRHSVGFTYLSINLFVLLSVTRDYHPNYLTSRLAAVCFRLRL